jgi:glyceraldehyde-3-phosphate dehydrogenase/erythrose-4-phosphate dehydrogenase
MTTRVAINGFGRVGRSVPRIAYEQDSSRLVDLAARVMAPVPAGV